MEGANRRFFSTDHTVNHPSIPFFTFRLPFFINLTIDVGRLLKIHDKNTFRKRKKTQNYDVGGSEPDVELSRRLVGGFNPPNPSDN
jgi:hypothetical protein